MAMFARNAVKLAIDVMLTRSVPRKPLQEPCVYGTNICELRFTNVRELQHNIHTIH